MINKKIPIDLGTPKRKPYGWFEALNYVVTSRSPYTAGLRFLKDL
jgi:hypothetical protein